MIPLNDWILVTLFPIPEVSKGGIIIGGGAAATDRRVARVDAVGPGKMLESGVRAPMDVKVGDIVVFDRWHTEHKTGAASAKVLGDGRGLVKPEDIFFVVEFADGEDRNPRLVYGALT